MNILHTIVGLALFANTWIRGGWKYDLPTCPDKLYWIDPSEIKYMPSDEPSKGTLVPTFVASGDWDQDLTKITDDIVYRSFHRRFIDGEDWTQTGYVEFLSDSVSQHGNRTTSEALERCQRMDDLYEYIEEHGYKSQRELERNGDLIKDLTDFVRPPAYREVEVNITRDGTFVWHAGIHRLVIAQLLDINEIPVRVHIRHEKWQKVRENAYNGRKNVEYEHHPDIKHLMS